MAITLFYTFAVLFADAAPTTLGVEDASTGEHVDGIYRIQEEVSGGWKACENGQPIDISPEQHDELKRLLQALRPLPDATAQPTMMGCDGTWYTIEVSTGGARQSYRWWFEPPPEWARLASVIEYVEYLAESPRQALAEQNRAVAQQYFDRLAARDVDGAMACCAAQIEYSSPFLDGLHARHGREAVRAMWQAWLQMRPDARIACDDIRAGHQHATAHWTADYLFPNMPRPVHHRISADLSFAGGKITRHRDRFSLHEWASRAYGTRGSVLGGKKMFQRRIVARERERLLAFEDAL